ncbi:N-acetylmuramoyl-L-alanine amidase, partial [Pseudomonas hunanensis]|uniref:N-acetylmuramoyl-L-alanine amidase n=1 Tax=Pseudomonas hunanensis TaxID=1247546 RepID=UPI0030DAB6C8
NRSAAFAHMLLDRLDGRTAVLHRSQRDAGFAVLLAPDVPAVLLEMGFITNPDDEATLSDPERRGRLVDGIAEAVDDYFAAVQTKLGPVEALINNAAIVPATALDEQRRTTHYAYITTPVPRRSLQFTSQMTDEDWLRFWDVNV